MNYSEIKKLYEESLQQLKEGSGPSDKCICGLLSPAEEKKGIRASIKRAFASLSRGRKKRSMNIWGQKGVDIPLSFTKGGKGMYTTKEEVARKSTCGKCGCDSERFVLKHSFANIRITSPDVSTICPCPTDCLPNKTNQMNNIKVTVERVTVVDVDLASSGCSILGMRAVSEPLLHALTIQSEVGTRKYILCEVIIKKCESQIRPKVGPQVLKRYL